MVRDRGILLVAAVLVAAALVLVAASCGSSGTGPPAQPVALPQGGACGEVYFWAASESGDIVVTVSTDLRARSGSASTDVEFSLPDDAVAVEVLRGDGLPRNLCTDVIDMRHEPTSTQEATIGSGTIRLDPQGLCGGTGGELTLEGLVAADGSTFGPIQVQSEAVGCYSG